MINTTIKYIVYNHTGGGVRHHHFGTQNNIIDEADGQASPGDTLNALGFATLPFNDVNLPFAFMSVHGAADGNHLYTTPGNQAVPVGTTNIDILVVYAPAGGIGSGGGPGVWVDAFNVDTGDFSDSLDFVTILNPPTPPDSVDAPKTTFANMEGEVSTVVAENIRANQHVDGVAFLEWKKITPTASIVNIPEIHLSQGETSEIWFAFYQTVKSPIGIAKVRDLIEAGIFLWTGDPDCGNGGHRVPIHGPGPSPFKLSIKKDAFARLAPEQQKKLKGYVAEYPKVANLAHIEITNMLNLLKGVNDILSGIKRR
jgi:hypothetical protein